MKSVVLLTLLLLILPSMIWLLLKSFHSPWWLENIFSTPYVIPVVALLMIICFSRVMILSVACVVLLMNSALAFYLDNMSLDNTSHLNTTNKSCTATMPIFQFNLKYNEKPHDLASLVLYLKSQPYQLISLQGVSLSTKNMLVDELSPYFPYFINTNSMKPYAHSDQLLFSLYAFKNTKHYKHGQSTFLISSLWQTPNIDIQLYALHPPSPRSESLWKIRNKTLYQLAHELEKNSKANAVVIGDLNISAHSARLESLTHNMSIVPVNSWPKIEFLPAFIGVAIDQLWLSSEHDICQRARVTGFDWSDHYPIATQINLSLNRDIE